MPAGVLESMDKCMNIGVAAGRRELRSLMERGGGAVWRYSNGTGCESSSFRERGSVLTGERESLPIVSKEGL